MTVALRWHLLFALLVCVAGFAAACGVALAHQAPSGWAYPGECCSNNDCRHVEQTTVRKTSKGYVVPSGELVPYDFDKLRDSPDGEYHWCTVGGTDKGKTLCLFVPGAGT